MHPKFAQVTLDGAASHSRRNPYFTSRAAELDRIHGWLTGGEVVTVRGMGGVGKAQTVIEYAYRAGRRVRPGVVGQRGQAVPYG